MDFVDDSLPTPGPAAGADPAQIAIVVLGMHRTGTSALTGVLSMLGAGAPANLQPANEFNAKGYWESRAIMRLNDRILQAGGSSWRDCTAFDDDRLADGVRTEFVAEIAKIVAAEFGEAPLIVIKDPRICRLAPLWLEGLDRAGMAPKIVIPIRNPLESALSLLERDGIQVQEGLLLWLRHMLDAEGSTRGRRRCFVPFNALLDDWRAATDGISSALEVKWPVPPPASGNQIDQFLSRDLQHQRSSYQDLQIRADALDWVVATYDSMMKLSAPGEPQGPHLDEIDRIRGAFEQASRVFGPVVQHKNAEIGEFAKRTREVEARLAQVAQAAEVYQRERDAARASLSAREVELGRETTMIAELESSRRQLILARLDLHKVNARVGGDRALFSWRGLEPLRRLCDALARSRGDRDRPKRPEAEQLDLIKASGLFDPAWYLESYPDVRHFRLDPLIHYLRHGASEGRDPSAHFSTVAYQRRYPDVARAGINPLLHFLQFGIREGRHFEAAPPAASFRQSDVPHRSKRDRAIAHDG